MGAAKDEKEVLTHMAACFAPAKCIGPTSHNEWRTRKLEALMAVEHAVQPTSMVDLGVGDLTHLEDWLLWKDGGISYLGVEGCLPIYTNACAAWPDHNFVLSTFSQLIDEAQDVPKGVVMADLVTALDVLYHQPDDAVHDAMVNWIFGHARQAVVLTYATAVQEFGGKKPGQGGFAWFPRPYVPKLIPDGWEVIYQSDYTGGAQKQRLLALVRS